MSTVNTMACVGTGNVGRAWAIVFARAGWNVRLFDANSQSVHDVALPMIRRNLADLVTAGMLEDAAAAEARISVANSLEDAVRDVHYVQESAKEDTQVKTELFTAMDRFAPPQAILASSTSAIPGSAFLENVPGRARCLVAHPVNPPYLIPLVEICASPWTSPETVTACEALMTAVGQSPIRVNKEIRGFILNRLQFALVGEAMHLVGEGYCSVDDIDKVMTAGLARRWSFIGPFEVAHLNGSAGYRSFMEGLGPMVRSITREVQVDYPWDNALVDRIHQHLAKRTPVTQVANRQAWRDRKLMEVARLLAELHADDGST